MCVISLSFRFGRDPSEIGNLIAAHDAYNVPWNALSRIDGSSASNSAPAIV